jgi:hypothetical protein
MTGRVTTLPEEAKELLDRVASSSQFQKSKRLRQVLLYLGERALKDPNCVLREQEIGVGVLGRPPDYDTSHDTLVRVLVSHLRKKLQEHFEGEGRDEPLVIEIPKGTYLPVFHPRQDNSRLESTEEAPPPVETARTGRQWFWMVLAAVALVLSGAATTLMISRASSRTPRPTVTAFWSQLFGNGQSTYLVLSDVTLIVFENLMGRPVSLSEYEAHEFDRLADLRIQNPVQRDLAREFVNRVTTALSDVQVARDFGILAAQQHLPLTIISARDMSSPLVASSNVILLGSRRANPWVGLFEGQLNFQTEYHESPPAMRFVNRSPQAHEQPAYAAEWRRTGYCRLSFLPNPRHTGNVLLISGSDVISTEAGGRFVASEDSMRQLRRMLHLQPGLPIPHFELLLRTQIVNSTVPWFEVVASRLHV